MRRMSIRLRITIWFSIIIIVVIALTYTVILSVSNSLMQKAIMDDLIEVVGNNADEIEYFDKATLTENYDKSDLYIQYNNAYIEIDDDFLDSINNIYTALYTDDGNLIYGENPISTDTDRIIFKDCTIQKQSADNETWYIFDRHLTRSGLSGLWLRGVVSAKQETAQISSTVRITMFLIPVLLFCAVVGGYYISGKSLKPINQIIATASQISKGRDLKKRIVLGKGSYEVYEMANAFNTMFDRLDNAFQAEQQFASDASHELRTPMSVIMAQCEYTLDDERSADEYRDALRVIRRQGRKMAALIEDLLAFTRLERKADSYEMETLDYSTLVAWICEDMVLMQKQGIKLTYKIEPDIFIFGNSGLLTVLITNLISNAYKYGKENGYIQVELKMISGEAVLSVKDNGIGIEKEDCEKIFNRFYQVNTSRSMEGNGLGLAMVQEIALLHNGKISVESRINEGSVFHFKLESRRSIEDI